MSEFSAQKNIIILCDSWYAKKDLVCVVDEYSNLDVICNARNDSVMYGLALQHTGKRGRFLRRKSDYKVRETIPVIWFFIAEFILESIFSIFSCNLSCLLPKHLEILLGFLQRNIHLFLQLTQNILFR